ERSNGFGCWSANLLGSMHAAPRSAHAYFPRKPIGIGEEFGALRFEHRPDRLKRPAPDGQCAMQYRAVIVLPLPRRQAAVAGSRAYRKWRGAAPLHGR